MQTRVINKGHPIVEPLLARRPGSLALRHFYWKNKVLKFHIPVKMSKKVAASPMGRPLLMTALLLLAACASPPTQIPSNAVVGNVPKAWATPPILPKAAAPRIVAMHFSSLDVRRGQVWRASFVVSTNTKAMEVRTNLFAINVPRIAAGRFAFSLDVFDTPPIFLRGYRLRVIARNAAGAATEENAPFRIR